MRIYQFKKKNIRAKAAAAMRQKSQRRKQEAAAAGLTTEQLLAERIEAYWRKVEDPEYYKGMRNGASLRCALGGLK